MEDENLIYSKHTVVSRVLFPGHSFISLVQRSNVWSGRGPGTKLLNVTLLSAFRSTLNLVVQLPLREDLGTRNYALSLVPRPVRWVWLGNLTMQYLYIFSMVVGTVTNIVCTIFSAAVFSINLDPCPGLPGQVTVNPKEVMSCRMNLIRQYTVTIQSCVTHTRGIARHCTQWTTPWD